MTISNWNLEFCGFSELLARTPNAITSTRTVCKVSDCRFAPLFAFTIVDTAWGAQVADKFAIAGGC